MDIIISDTIRYIIPFRMSSSVLIGAPDI
jgi:hypothetical protein